MAKTAKSIPAVSTQPGTMQVNTEEVEAVGRMKARVAMRPLLRNASVANTFASTHFLESQAPLMDAIAVLAEDANKAANGDLAFASQMLAAQAVTLDTLFTEMARRSGVNMGQHFSAAETYMRLALKAQSNCRATLEALAKLHQPREQTVRHVHVNEGGQAVIADQFHHHIEGTENGKAANQPHAPYDRAVSASPALPGQNSCGDALPMPGSEGREAVSNARGTGKRRTRRQ